MTLDYFREDQIFAMSDGRHEDAEAPVQIRWGRLTLRGGATKSSKTCTKDP